MMIQNTGEKREQIQLLCIDNMVPQGHLLRIIDGTIDRSFIYELVEDKYSQDNGRPSMDPTMPIKIPFIQYLCGIKSIRQTIKEIEVNVAYHQFLGLDILDKMPHFSTFGKNYVRHLKDTDLFEQIFTRILSECYKFKLVGPNEVFVDTTHVEARADNKKIQRRIAHNETLSFEDLLKQETSESRGTHGKRPLKEKESDNNTLSGGAGGKEEKTVKASTSNPENGWFRKGERKHVFAYAVQTTCGRSGQIFDYSVRPGNSHDGRTSKFLYDKIKGIGVEALIVDAGYKTPGVAKLLIDRGVKPLLPYKRPLTKEDFFKKYEYVYDEYYDCYICPNNQVLTYRTTNRKGYHEYRSYGSACISYAYLAKHIQSKDHVKTVMRHIWEPYMEMCEEIRQTLGMKELYSQRKETIERVFGNAKEDHGSRYTQMFGRIQMEMKVGLTSTCMNLKKLAEMKAEWGTARFANFILNTIWLIGGNWLWDTKPKTSLSTV